MPHVSRDTADDSIPMLGIDVPHVPVRVGAGG